MSSFSRQQLENWLKQIDVKADNLLDWGGSQKPIKGRTKSWDVKRWEILDIEEPHECKEPPDFILNIAKTITLLKKYDVIFCIEVMEYVYDPVKTLKNIYDLLNHGGILYISYHTTYPLHKPTGLDYLRYTYYGIEKLLKEAGFEIEEHKLRKLKGERRMLEIYTNEFKFDRTDIEKVLSSGGMIKAIKK